MKSNTAAQLLVQPGAPDTGAGHRPASELSALIAQSIAMWERVFALHVCGRSRAAAPSPPESAPVVEPPGDRPE